MSIAITGATGKLGRLVIESLLARGVPAADITAVGRSADKLGDLAARGVNIAIADYKSIASLEEAFSGATKVLLVSSNDFNDRAGQHRNVIDAAKSAGVSHLVYTSGPKAATSSILLLADHATTEAIIAESGMSSTILRNGWYVENYTQQLPTYLEHGMLGSAGEGKVSLAPRSDFAEAAAVVLTTDGHIGKVYELGGESHTLTDLAAIFSSATGSTISYVDVPLEAYANVLSMAGMPEPLPQIFSDVDRGIAAGELYVEGNDLESLLGRPATPVAVAVAQELAAK